MPLNALILPQRFPSVIINEDSPLYISQSPLEPSTILTETLEKGRKLKFYMEHHLLKIAKDQAERETRRNDVRHCHSCRHVLICNSSSRRCAK